MHALPRNGTPTIHAPVGRRSPATSTRDQRLCPRESLRRRIVPVGQSPCAKVLLSLARSYTPPLHSTSAPRACRCRHAENVAHLEAPQQHVVGGGEGEMIAAFHKVRHDSLSSWSAWNAARGPGSPRACLLVRYRGCFLQAAMVDRAPRISAALIPRVHFEACRVSM